MERLIEGTLNGLVEMIGHVTMAMFGVPSPNVGEVNGGSVEPSATLAHAYGGLSWLIIAVTMLSLLVALARMFWTLEAAESKVIIRMMVNLVASTTVILGMVVLALEFSDRASPWLMVKISGYSEDEVNSGAKFTEALMGIDMSGTKGVTLFADLALVGLILLVIVFFGVLATILFLIVRNPLLVAMCAFLPLFAASSGTRAGQERFNKALAYIVAFVLYKPVAAILLGIGLRMLKPLDAEKQPLMTFISGAVLVALTGIALPAMIKLFAGEASVGSSNAFSGGAVVAAGGAAVMSSAMLAGSFASGGASAGGAGGFGGGAAGAGASPPPTPPTGGGGQPPSGGGGASGDGGPPVVGPSGGSGGGAGASGDSGPPGAGSSGEGGSSGDSGGAGGAGDPGFSGGSGETGGSDTGEVGGDGAGGSAGSSGADGEGRSGAGGAQSRDGMHGQEGQQGLSGSSSSGAGTEGASGSGGATGAAPGAGHQRTAEGAQLVGSRALGKAALAAGTGGQQAVQGATGAANDMSQGA